MTTSNVFRVEPGLGTARLNVSGGSAQLRTFGLGGMLFGVPVSLAGFAFYGVGKVQDQPTLVTTGIVTLAIGAISTLASLPLLAVSGTRVRDGQGRSIARVRPVDGWPPF
jgi:hypothetical protein